jgi:hypothetical protein
MPVVVVDTQYLPHGSVGWVPTPTHGRVPHIHLLIHKLVFLSWILVMVRPSDFLDAPTPNWIIRGGTLSPVIDDHDMT